MGSSITSLASAIAPAFTGVSKFGASLQQVLARAEGIASLPLDALNAQLTTLSNKQTALGTVNTAFSGLKQATVSLQNTLDSSLLNSSVSDAGIVGANVGAGAAPGTYSIEVDSLGAYSNALSSGGTPAVNSASTQGISDSATFTLSVGNSSTTITPASSSLQDLAAAINSQASGEVQATVVNVGPGSSPDYRLSLRSVSLGSDSIALTTSSGTSLISSSTAGALSSYKIDGVATPISSTSRNVTLAPGVTLNLLGLSTAGQPATITLSDNASALASGFSAFAQSYNNAVDAINQNHGQNGGALQGDSLLQTLTGVLSQLGNYNNGTPASALANYGITLDKAGHLSVDTTAFTNAASLNFPALLSTLGTSTGGGFLKSATDLLNSVEDPITGLVPTESKSITDAITSQQSRISDEQATINTLQTNLTAEISKADSAIASLESQVSYVTGLFGQYTGATNTQTNGLATL